MRIAAWHEENAENDEEREEELIVLITHININ